MTKDAPKGAPNALDAKTIGVIESIARQVRASIDAGRLPDISLPVRSLDNVKYDQAKGYFELGGAHKVRTLTVNTARAFAQTLRLMATSRTMVEHDDYATKREVYYISKNWGECRFDEQAESDAIMDDIEAVASVHGCHASNCVSIRSRTVARLPVALSSSIAMRRPGKPSRSTVPTWGAGPIAFRVRLSI